jgi:DNA polymerase-1
MDCLVLIDGNAILHRAYHALPPLTTSKGELVNAIFGFASMLLKIRDELHPSHLAVSFDLPKPTFRQNLFKDYQAQRPAMAQELSGQIEKVKELVKVVGIPIYERAGYEADDVIGTLARQALPKVGEVVVVTGDRDLLQLVNPKTKVYMLLRGITEATLYNEDKVREKLGLNPGQIADYKALVGDSSDNYPGVIGIGPKTAVKLLQSYQSLEQLYKKIAGVDLSLREKLLKGKEDARLSQKLATIVCDCPVVLDLGKAKAVDFNQPEVVKFFEKLEFKSLIPRLVSRQQAAAEEKRSDEQMGLFK